MDGRALFGVRRSHVQDVLETGKKVVSPVLFMNTGVEYSGGGGCHTGGSNRRFQRFKMYPSVSPFIGVSNGYIAGLVKEENLPAIGKLVRVHRKETGELAGQALSQEGGYFKISGLDRDTDEYYVVAFNDSPGKNFNALVFDRVDPILDAAYDLDTASQNILEQQPLAYWKNVLYFLKNGIYYDFGSLRKDVVIDSSNFSSIANAWSDEVYSLRRMGRLFQQGCYFRMPDLMYNNLEFGWTIEIFLRFNQASNNENLFEAISEYASGPSLVSHANTVRLGRVGTTNDIRFEVYGGSTLLASGQSSSGPLASGIPTVISMTYNGVDTVKVYQKGTMLFSTSTTIPNIPRPYTTVCKNSMSGTSQFKGNLSEVAVFATALNPLQLQAHSDLL